MKRLLFFAIVLIAFACNNDDDPTPTDPEVTTENIHLLKKIYLDGELFSSREYSTDSILLRINNYKADTIWFYTAYENLGDTIMTSFRQSNDNLTSYRKTYELPDNTVRVDRFDDDGSFKNHTIYHYEAGDCGYSKLVQYGLDGMQSSIEEVAFTDDNCSYSSTFFNTSSQIVNTVQITRDDASIYIHFPRVDMLRLNNLGGNTEYKIWDQDGILLEENSYTGVNEYNDEGYLTMITRTYFDGNIQVYTYEY